VKLRVLTVKCLKLLDFGRRFHFATDLEARSPETWNPNFKKRAEKLTEFDKQYVSAQLQM
jgi:hypothetical protein